MRARVRVALAFSVVVLLGLGVEAVFAVRAHRERRAQASPVKWGEPERGNDLMTIGSPAARTLAFSSAFPIATCSHCGEPMPKGSVCVFTTDRGGVALEWSGCNACLVETLKRGEASR